MIACRGTENKEATTMDVQRPVLLVTAEEYTGVVIGHGGKAAAPPGTVRDWDTTLRLARWGLRPDGRPMTGREWRALQKLADIGRLVREAGALITATPGPLPPLAERLAALEPHAKTYLASRRKAPRREDPKQLVLFREVGQT
jgi:hypothetical protein